MTLTAYIDGLEAIPDEQQLFVEYARLDGQLPDARSWDELKGYLTEIGVDNDMILSARHTWHAFHAERTRPKRNVWRSSILAARRGNRRE